MNVKNRVWLAGFLGFVVSATAFWPVQSAQAMGPNVVFSPAKGEAGSAFEIRGTGFHPGEKVFINWDHPGEPLAQTAADGAGDLTADVIVPASAPDGRHKVTLAGDKGSVAVHIFLLGDVPPAKSPSPPAKQSNQLVYAAIGLAVGLVFGFSLRSFRSSSSNKG